MLAIAALLLGASALQTGCATPGQNATALTQAAGEAGGAYLLGLHSTNGVVDPAYLAGYETVVPKVAAVMQGAITPADFQLIVSSFKSSGKLSAGQLGALGFANSITASFVQYNGGNNLTPDGAAVALAAGNLAVGMGEAVGLVTGVNWTPPTWVPPTANVVTTPPVAVSSLVEVPKK